MVARENKPDAAENARHQHRLRHGETEGDKQADQPGGDKQRARGVENLPGNVAAHRRVRRRPRHHQTRRRGNQQGRYLRDQSFADGQQRVVLQDLHHVLPFAQAHGKAAENVQNDNDNRRNRIAPDKLVRAVHCAVKIRFLPDSLAPGPRLLLIDNARVQIGVNRHLLARHGIQSKPRRHFRHAPRAGRDDHKLHHHQQQKHDNADHIIAADDHLPERRDHMARAARADNQLHRRDFQGQPEQRRHEKQARETRKIAAVRWYTAR